MSAETDAVLDQFPEPHATDLRIIRDLVTEIAANDDDIGTIVEELKWGQVSLATRPKTGTPLRLGLSDRGHPAVFVHCQTRLLADIGAGLCVLRPLGARGVEIPDMAAGRAELRRFIHAALRYHLS